MRVGMETHPFADATAGGPGLESLPVEPLLTSEFDGDPGSVYERLRSTYGPVAPVGLMGVPAWLVLDYREVLEVLRNESVWRRDVRHWRARAEGRLPRDWPLLAGYEVRQTMFFDDEEHRHARLSYHSAMRPFQDGHSPEGWELRAAVARYADELIDVLAAESGTTGFADLAAQYTRPLLLMVTTKLFGCPVELGDEMVMDLWRMLDGGPDAGAATGRALGTMTRLAAHRRSRPGEDLTSYLLLSDPSLSDEQLGRELFMNAVYLNDITGNMVCNTLLEVLRGNTTVRRSLSNGQLGGTALAGERVWQRDQRMRLTLGPMSREKLRRFLPGGPGALALRELLGLLTGVSLEYEIRLALRAEDVQGVRLAGDTSPRLGWDGFLVTRAAAHDRSDAGYDLHALA